MVFIDDMLVCLFAFSVLTYTYALRFAITYVRIEIGQSERDSIEWPRPLLEQ